jgi:hypothetical protein
MQTKKGSIFEAFINILIGYGINLGAQIIIFPMFGIHIPLSSNIGIGLAFTGISLTRSYLIRRLFNRREDRHEAKNGTRYWATVVQTGSGI